MLKERERGRKYLRWREKLVMRMTEQMVPAKDLER